mmetsp:Transcript_128492/g.357687  ORF Transcript_128492/g.357687 Transcript_128492/m.357687 type:complete len:312 (-) Transcript_128492:53-988(-)
MFAATVHSPPLHQASSVGIRDLLPLLLQHGVDEVVGPLAGRVRPGSDEAAGVIVAPAEGVAASDERRGLRVVHAHASEDIANLSAARHRVRDLRAVLLVQRTFRVHVDEAHSDASQGLLACPIRRATRRCPIVLESEDLAVCAVALVHAAEAMREGGASHGAHSHGACKGDEVAPTETIAILLLDGPQEGEGLVEVGVVHPANLGLEADPGTRTTTPLVGVSVSASAVPGQADHEAAVVATVRRPAFLARSHGMRQVLLQSFDVQVLECRSKGCCIGHLDRQAVGGRHSHVRVAARGASQGRQEVHRQLHG